MKNLNELIVLIIGLGQIGGSVAIDLTRRRVVNRVVGFDTDAAVVDEAVQRGIIDRAARSMEEAAGQADLVILAAPIRKIVNLIPIVCDAVRDGAAIMDVAGTKSEIRRVVEEQKRPVTYIGGHPMAGTEGHGIGDAEAGKFSGQTFILTPIRETNGGWLETIHRLVESVGAIPVLVSAEEHDRIIAATSHLPYVIAVAMMRLAAKRAESLPVLWELVGGSFSDLTRVTASSPDLTLDMLMTNRMNIVRAIDSLIKELNVVKDAVYRSHEPFLAGMIAEARGAKQRQSNKKRVRTA